MKQYIVAGLAAGLLAGTLIASAPPASAGCVNKQTIGGDEKICDAPIRPDGTWERCLVLMPTDLIDQCYILDGNRLPPFEQPYIEPTDPNWP